MQNSVIQSLECKTCTFEYLVRIFCQTLSPAYFTLALDLSLPTPPSFLRRLWCKLYANELKYNFFLYIKKISKILVPIHGVRTWSYKIQTSRNWNLSKNLPTNLIQKFWIYTIIFNQKIFTNCNILSLFLTLKGNK